MIKNLVIFTISDQDFAADIQKVSLILKTNEVFKSQFLTPAKNTISKIGITEIKIIDLHTILNLLPKKINHNTRLLVVESDKKVCGFIVDKVKEIVSVDVKITEPAFQETVEGDLKKGLPFNLPIIESDNQQLVLLDLEKLMSDEKHEFYRFAEIQTNVSK
ncbi:MAG: chemotaxis protein CheW [Bacteroidota bacterium]|nr:chemotaxis protein CheW [Bacteroidota bacterium]